MPTTVQYREKNNNHTVKSPLLSHQKVKRRTAIKFFLKKTKQCCNIDCRYVKFAVDMKIEQEIQQPHFKSEHHKAHINILFTAAWLTQQVTQALKEYGISTQQFNILRILKGQYPNAVTVKLLRKRMIDKMSNASRLVEKLRQKELVERTECPKDRRRVDIVLTDKGMSLVNSATDAVNEQLKQYMESISIEEAQIINELLDKMRGT